MPEQRRQDRREDVLVVAVDGDGDRPGQEDGADAAAAAIASLRAERARRASQRSPAVRIVR